MNTATWPGSSHAGAMDDARCVLQKIFQTGGFSFTYGGKSSDELLPKWLVKKQRRATRDGFVIHTIARTDQKTGLVVIQEIKEYTDFPVVEWGLRLRNTSKKKTQIITDIKSLDFTLELGKFPYLNYWNGDYYPLTPYSRDQTKWIAWQFHRPDRNTGMAQAFRRKNCATSACVLHLQGMKGPVTGGEFNLNGDEWTLKIESTAHFAERWCVIASSITFLYPPRLETNK